MDTPRLFLRPFSVMDSYDVFEYAKENVVALNAGWRPHKSLDETIYTINEVLMKNQNCWAIVLKSENKVIGSISLHQRAYQGYELGYVLNPLYWHQGFALEASKKVVDYGFIVLNAPLITIRHFEDNLRSQKVIQKLNFKFMGIDPKSTMRPDNKIVDMFIYMKTKEMYINERNKIKI